MLIRKTAGFFLAALLLAAAALGIVAAFPSRTAAADAPATLTTENADLFLPETYEQYLALVNPSDVALSPSYLAVADGNILYIYDRTNESYSKTELQNSGDTITKIGFAGERLFVSTRGASGIHCYEYNFESGANDRLETLSFNCSTFCINGETLYAASVGGPDTTIASCSVADLKSANSNAHSLGTLNDENTTPSMTFLGGTLYCTVNDRVYYNDLNANETFDDEKCFYLSSTASDARHVKSTCAHEGAFYYTASDGLYRATFSSAHKAEEAVLVLADENLGALTSYGGSLYAVKGDAICRIDFDGGEAILSGYEISAASASQNRLDSAGECVRAGDLLVTADTGNNRISVYDTAEKRFVTLECAGVKDVATDGEIIAATTEEGIYIFEKVLNSETLDWEFSRTKAIQASNVVGVVCVYGTFYYVTEDFRYGKITREGDEWKTADTQHMGATPKDIAADLFGDIYVAAVGGNVYKFGEEDFVANGELGSSVTTIDENFTSLRVGFDGTLYYLDENGKFCGEGGESVDINGAEFVYTDEENKTPVSFALGYEDDEVYFCFGDFIVKSKAGKLGLETLETLSETVLKESEETLSAVADAENVRLVDCKQNAVGVRVDLSALQGEDAFAAGYFRYTEARRGVVLDKQSEYSLVAIYDGHVYTAEIFRNVDVGAAFAPEKTDAEGVKMYLSSDCPAYHFPCIADLPAREETPLPRGTAVRVLAYFDEGGQEEAQGGYTFAYVEYEAAARSTLRCYVPVAYLSEADPLGGAGETYTLGYVKPGATFTGSDGNQLVTEERVQARLYKNEDGTYTARYEKDGVVYTATVEEGQIEWGESDALRIALIVILSVVAVLIIGGYVFLLPWNKKQIK